MDKGQRWPRTPTNWLIKSHVFDTSLLNPRKGWILRWKSGHFQCRLQRISGIFNIPVCGGFCAPTRNPEEWLEEWSGCHPWDDNHQILGGLLEPPVSVLFGDYHIMISLWCIIVTVILQVCNIIMTVSVCTITYHCLYVPGASACISSDAGGTKNRKMEIDLPKTKSHQSYPGLRIFHISFKIGHGGFVWRIVASMLQRQCRSSWTLLFRLLNFEGDLSEACLQWVHPAACGCCWDFESRTLRPWPPRPRNAGPFWSQPLPMVSNGQTQKGAVTALILYIILYKSSHW